MRTRGLITLAVATSALLVSCGVEPAVTAERSDQIASQRPTETTSPNTGPPTTAPETTDPTQDDPAQNDPGQTEPPTTEPSDPTPTDPTSTAPSPSVAPDEIDPAAINFGPNKTPHDYDDFLLAVMTDLESWWSEQYPAVYGDAFQSLSGGVYAAYPNRPDDLPGCGEPRTTYDDVQQFVAFYCGRGRLHHLRRRRRGAARPARRPVRPGHDRDRVRPRVRPRHPDTVRGARPRPADHLHRAAVRLLRRRVGRRGSAAASRASCRSATPTCAAASSP